MLLSSMTGFARAQGQMPDFEWVWEIKSVNGKSLDVKAKVPSWLDEISSDLKSIAQKYFERGSLGVYLDLVTAKSEQKVSLNEGLFNEVMKLTRMMEENGAFAKASAGEILSIPGLFEVEKKHFDDETMVTLQKELLSSYEACCQALQADRQVEGNKIKLVLGELIDRIEKNVNTIESLAKDTPQTLKEKLLAQINELVGGNVPISEERIAQEVVVLVNRADIREEIDRLYTHISTARELLAKNQTLGRRFDFLCQEFNREANTTCSKAAKTETVNLGIELKTLIEQLREQVQNLE